MISRFLLYLTSIRTMLTSVTDERGNATTYTYDTEDRLLSVTDPEGGAVVYTYTAAGQLASAKRPEMVQ